MRPALAIAAVVLIAGCGGSGRHLSTQAQAPPTQPRVRALPARPSEVALIRRWADTLRAGHVAAASRLFHVPALAQNGGPELALQSFADVRLFNESLPCGAVLLEAKRVAGGYTLAVFRLTDRPGGDCGQGTGQRAAAAFRFERGLISDWRRAAVPQFEQAEPKPRV